MSFLYTLINTTKFYCDHSSVMREWAYLHVTHALEVIKLLLLLSLLLLLLLLFCVLLLQWSFLLFHTVPRKNWKRWLIALRICRKTWWSNEKYRFPCNLPICFGCKLCRKIVILVWNGPRQLTSTWETCHLNSHFKALGHSPLWNI